MTSARDIDSGHFDRKLSELVELFLTPPWPPRPAEPYFFGISIAYTRKNALEVLHDKG